MDQTMEWSKEKTLKLIELLQLNANLWNPSLCESRKDKQKKKDELRLISQLLSVSLPDVTKKIQHLRTQYNRESTREARANAEDPSDRYVSNWYAFEYLHFFKDSNKPYRVLEMQPNSESNNILNQPKNSIIECKIVTLSPPHMNTTNKADSLDLVKSENPSSTPQNRDEFTVFGEYIANELRSLKGEKNVLVAKKKIQDVIFEVKMGMFSDTRIEQHTSYTVETHTSQPQSVPGMHRCSVVPLTGKLYATPIVEHIL